MGREVSINDVTLVNDVVEALDKITGGRVIKDLGSWTSGENPFVVTKSSNIPGKAITETPGLVIGNPVSPVRRLGVCMTLTESHLELAGALKVDTIVAHHPVADAANSGGVPLRNYVSLYGISILELHEAFHGLHPGIAFIHGHNSFRVEIAFGGVPGNIINVGHVLKDIKTAGDVVNRIRKFMGLMCESDLLRAEKGIRECEDLYETNVAAQPEILAGDESSPSSVILHIYPHTGFNEKHLSQVLTEQPDIDTIIASISRVRSDHPLVATAKARGLNFIVGNTHALEILENGMPLAFALQELLPRVEIFLFRERVVACPANTAGNQEIREYAQHICRTYLLPPEQTRINH
ncbi:MAG: hypothetical protein PWR02_1217 [Synergistales bacterium]|jgi:hypothetical protein|nr:hypothetical protein [Synergistales bacterium]MDN5336191.1 hypothetical protein [Synergistales bacterium]